VTPRTQVVVLDDFHGVALDLGPWERLAERRLTPDP
jgi:hypothetical protein